MDGGFEPDGGPAWRDPCTFTMSSNIFQLINFIDLVGGLWHLYIYIYTIIPYIGNVIIPIDFHIFQRPVMFSGICSGIFWSPVILEGGKWWGDQFWGGPRRDLEGRADLARGGHWDLASWMVFSGKWGRGGLIHQNLWFFYDSMLFLFFKINFNRENGIKWSILNGGL